jgi:hypothetical protein
MAVIFMRKKNSQRSNYELEEFLNEIVEVRKNWPNVYIDDILPTEVVLRLGRLAKVFDNELFQIAIKIAVLNAYADAITLARPVYLGQLINRLDKVKQAALLLGQEIFALLNSEDRITELAKDSLCAVYKLSSSGNEDVGERSLSEIGTDVSILVSMIKIAKYSAPRVVPTTRGRPSGAGGSGMAVDRLIARLEFAARAAGGKLTLNKNDERGTLIDALEDLRNFLPAELLPPKRKYPYSSYQRILTQARYDWNNSAMPQRMMRLIASQPGETDQK